MGMHSPVHASLRGECKKAKEILESFINGGFTGSPGKELPARILANAKGLAILTITKAGILCSARFGSGILLARLPNGTWSAPSAIATFGLGAGGQAGFELTDFVFILNDERAVRTFSRAGSLTLAGNFSVAFGPVGRNAEYASGVNVGAEGIGAASMYSYAKTKGLFGGVSLEGGMLVENRWLNRRFYGKGVSVLEVLAGNVAGPEEGAALAEILGGEMFCPVEGSGSRGNEDESQSQSQGQGQSENPNGRESEGERGEEAEEGLAVVQEGMPVQEAQLDSESKRPLDGETKAQQPSMS